MKKLSFYLLFPALIALYSCNQKPAKLDDLKFNYKPMKSASGINSAEYDFDGYTDHWDKYNWDWNSYAGVYDKSNSHFDSDILQMEMNQGNQLLLEELWIQPGFVNHLNLTTFSFFHISEKSSKGFLNYNHEFSNLDGEAIYPFSTKPSEVFAALAQGNVLIVGNDRDSLIKELLKKLPEDIQYRRTRAFELSYGKNNLFIITSQTQDEADKLFNYIRSTLDVIRNYKPYKGWAGVRAHYRLITQRVHSPYDVIDRALKMGCSWVMLDGYNDYMLTDPANKELAAIKLPFVFLPGQYGTGGIMYGTKTFPDVQDNTEIQCLDWMQQNHGYFFGYLSNMKSKNAPRYSGYIIVSTGDKVKLDSLKAPFITDAGGIDQAMPPSMILFLHKYEVLNQASIMKAVMDRRSVAVFPKADMYGDDKFRNALRILLLDKEYLESEISNPINVKCYLENNDFITEPVNPRGSDVQFTIKYLLPSSVSLRNPHPENSLNLLTHEGRKLQNLFDIKADACGKGLPVGVELDYTNGHKPTYSVCNLDVPNAVEQNPLIFDIPGTIDYPVTVWNYTDDSKVDINIEVKNNANGNIVFSKKDYIRVKKWKYNTMNFSIPLTEGDYTATSTALGVSRKGQISIRNEKATASIHTEDLNNDGIPEIVMENSKIRATILLFGGRVIEYILKSRNENMLFKLWPNKPPWDQKPEGRRAFYPYGGLEEFIGYPTIEGHIVFNYKILKDKGDYVRVKVWANIHGSKIEKIITLYGESELLEVRYAFSDMDESIRVIGVNPLVRIGKSTGPEDTYYFPDINGKIEERHPVLDRYYGNTFHLKEGWVAGYDTKEDLSLLVGYPVNDAEILHLWNNHPNNTPTPYFYTELQPWLLIKHGTVTYFTYYLMAREGKYEPILNDFRKDGLVTKKL